MFDQIGAGGWLLLLLDFVFGSIKVVGASLCPKINVPKSTSDRCQQNKTPSFVPLSPTFSLKRSK